MSYILDALRKAETERALSRVSCIASPRRNDASPRRAPARRWLYIIVAVACVLALTGWWAWYDVTKAQASPVVNEDAVEVVESEAASTESKVDGFMGEVPDREPSLSPQPVKRAEPTIGAAVAWEAPMQPVRENDASLKSVKMAERKVFLAPARAPDKQPAHKTEPIAATKGSKADQTADEDTPSAMVRDAPLLPGVEEDADEVVAMVALDEQGRSVSAADDPAPASAPLPENTMPEAPAVEETPREELPPPLLRTLPYRFQSTLPKIVINAQSYAEEAEARFVIINMKKYQEGQHTEAGILVESIGEKDLVLSYQGQLFRMER